MNEAGKSPRRGSVPGVAAGPARAAQVGGTPPKSARRRARELALQGVYQWLLSREDSGVIQANLAPTPGFEKADHEHFDALLHGTIRAVEEIDALIAPHLDRRLEELSPVEHAVMMLATFELLRMPEIPYRVVINEAVEVAKSYGGTDGYKYVNGVLDRVAARARPHEVPARG